MNNQESSTSRPFSDNLVDLHISVVPMKHWVEKLNSASCKIIGETFSVGFLRVLPDTPVSSLRGEISNQLGNDMFPDDYVFLKHVGRCLALVRHPQEKELKVKNFLPPHSIMPEIFILPGQPAMYSYKVLPPIQPRMEDLHISSSKTSASNITNYKTTSNPNRSLYTKSPYKYDNSEPESKTPTHSLVSEKTSSSQPHISYEGSGPPSHYQPQSKGDRKNPEKTRIPSSIQRPVFNGQQRHVSGKSNYENEVDPANGEPLSHSPNKNKKHENNSQQPSVPLTQPDDRRPSLVKSVLREGPRKRKVRYNMPSKSNNLSQDVEFNGDLHGLSHADAHRFADRSSSGSESSLRSLNGVVPDTQPETRFPESSANRSGRVRKQFIDTSSHVYPTSSNQSFVPPTNPHGFETQPSGGSTTPTQSPLTPPPIDVPDNPERAPPAAEIAYKGLESDLEVAADVTWESRGQIEAVKSSSANNDSGYVDHDVSDSDESFFKAKVRRRSVGNEDQLHSVKQEEEEEEEETIDTRVEENTNNGVRQDESSVHASEPVNYSLSSEEKAKVNSEEKSSQLIPSQAENNDSVTNSDATSSNRGQLRDQLDPSYAASDQKSKSPETKREFNHSDDNEFSEPPRRVFSEDSSYQYDFYDRPPPRGQKQDNTSLSDKANDNPSPSGPNYPLSSPVPREGSKLAYRLSENGYRVHSSREAPSDSSAYDHMTNYAHHHDQSFPFDFNPKPEEDHDDRSDANDEESDNDCYESSEDEFQRELANLVNKTNEPERESRPPSVESNRNRQNSPENISKKSNDFDSHQATDVTESSHLPHRESLSGSSLRSEKSANVQPPKLITVYSSSALDPVVANTFFDNATEEPLDIGQSRGDPDGMPTQRKVNTGGNEKPAPLLDERIEDDQLKPDKQDDPQIFNLTEGSDLMTQTHESLKPETVSSKTPEKPERIPTFTVLDPSPLKKKLWENVEENPNPSTVPSSAEIVQPSSTTVENKDGVSTKSPSQKSASDTAEAKTTEEVEDNKTVSDEDEPSKRPTSSTKIRLWGELQRIREERKKAEKNRQELVQHAKVVTSKTNQKRSSVRDAWKKKFFEEKKRTLPLEDTCRRLQGELDSSHRRLVTAMETNKPVQLNKFAPVLPPTFAPSTKNNNKIQAARLQHDMDILRRRIEDAKIKLTGEIKLRHQAEQDVKTIRQELLTKKIRAHLAYREMNRGHRFPLKV